MDECTCRRCGESFQRRGRHGVRPTVCDLCRPAEARDRANARHKLLRGDPDYELSRKAASRRKYEAIASDPVLAERSRAATREWRSKSGQALAEYGREYRKANADRIAEKNRRRRARLLGAWDEDVDIENVYTRDGGVCGVCGEPVDRSLTWPDKQSLTLDHIVPLARGGRHSSANCQVAHAVCNSRKNDRI